MFHKYPSLLILAFILFFIFLLIVPPLLSRGAWLYNTGTGHPIDPQIFVALAGWQFDPLETDSGIILPGLVRPPREASAPWVLFLPGNGSGQIGGGQSYLEHLAPLVRNKTNWGLAVWGMRGFDSTPGSPNTKEFRNDYQAVYQHLRNTYGVQAENIHLVGFSFGSDFAIQLAADISKKGEIPASISLLSTQGSIPPTRKLRRNKWYTRWLPVDKIDLSTAFNVIDSPVLIVEAEDDLRRPIESLITAFKKKPKYVELPRGDHSTSRKHEIAIDAVRNWITLNSTM